MISCTEFIPAYSELFTFLDQRYGRAEVDRLWDHLFTPDGKGIPLIHFIKKEGIRGCFSYWSGTLTEEASDCTLYLNEKAGWYLSKMEYCPSKGRLLKLKDEIGFQPYRDYCLHCGYYDYALREVGLIRHKQYPIGDSAACSSLIFDPKVFRGSVIFDENTEVLEVKAAEQEYFHPAFHSSMNRGLAYVGEVHGVQAIKDYFAQYVKNVLSKNVSALKKDGLSALENWIADTYHAEHAEDAVSLENDGKTLTVTVHNCPAVRFLQKIGSQISPYFRYSTEAVMQALADEGGVRFAMLSYDEESGAAAYRFVKE